MVSLPPPIAAHGLETDNALGRTPSRRWHDLPQSHVVAFGERLAPARRPHGFRIGPP
jgi:hypothetical protein